MVGLKPIGGPISPEVITLGQNSSLHAFTLNSTVAVRCTMYRYSALRQINVEVEQSCAAYGLEDGYFLRKRVVDPPPLVSKMYKKKISHYFG